MYENAQFFFTSVCHFEAPVFHQQILFSSGMFAFSFETCEDKEFEKSYSFSMANPS